VQRVSLNLGFSRKELDGKVLDDVAHFSGAHGSSVTWVAAYRYALSAKS
jgi:hypothetical protein